MITTITTFVHRRCVYTRADPRSGLPKKRSHWVTPEDWDEHLRGHAIRDEPYVVTGLAYAISTEAGTLWRERSPR